MATLAELFATQNVGVPQEQQELERLLATQNVSPQREALENLLATQNVPNEQAPMAPQAPASMAPVSGYEQALTQPASQVSIPQPSKLQSILTGLGATFKGGDAPKAMRDLQTQKTEEFKLQRQLQEDERKKNLESAKILEELHAQRTSLPTLKSTLKGLPGISPEIAAGIDSMDEATLRSFLPRLSDSFKLQNDIQDSLTRVAQQKETKRANIADEDAKKIDQEIQREHYAQLRSEAGEKRQEKQNTAITKRVDDTLDTLSTVKRGASAGTFGMAAKRSVLASDGLRIIDAIKSGQIVGDKAVQEELATVMASMLTGGQPGEHAIRAFQTRTGLTDSAKAAAYISSAPSNAISKAFLKQWEHQLEGQDKYYRELRDNTIKAQWEKLKPSLDKNEEEKKRFIRSLKANYPEYDIKRLGEKPDDYGFGPLDVTSAADSDIDNRIRELEAKKKAK